MKLRIIGIRDAGNLLKERVVMVAEGDGEIGRFLVASSRELANNTVSAKLKGVYWIPDSQVKHGDMVVVYTRSGEKNTIENSDHSHSYFLYRGESAPVYANANDCAVVLELNTWQTSKNRY